MHLAKEAFQNVSNKLLSLASTHEESLSETNTLQSIIVILIESSVGMAKAGRHNQLVKSFTSPGNSL